MLGLETRLAALQKELSQRANEAGALAQQQEADCAPAICQRNGRLYDLANERCRQLMLERPQIEEQLQEARKKLDALEGRS
jgi:chaperonin cofactor prefoldin